MLTIHRKRGRGHTVASAEPDPSVGDNDAVAVLLSAGLVELAPSLAQALGPGFAVGTDDRGVCRVMIVGPVGPTGVAFLRASHPGAMVLVVDRRWPSSRGHPDVAVIHLEAGADGYLLSPPVAEVASHVRALARRTGGRFSSRGFTALPAAVPPAAVA